MPHCHWRHYNWPRLAGRVALPCFGEPLRAQSMLYCVLNRSYVTAETAAVASDLATAMAQRFPGTITLTLDGNFPFVTGFPLLPHLSHDDGEKLDLAFYYSDAEGRPLSGETRSPLGYWAFENPSDASCPANSPTLRWNFAWAQGLFPDRPLDATRTAAAIRWLADDPRVTKIFVEPPLAQKLGVTGPKVRFQGCRAARHDDHIHFQL